MDRRRNIWYFKWSDGAATRTTRSVPYPRSQPKPRLCDGGRIHAESQIGSQSSLRHSKRLRNVHGRAYAEAIHHRRWIPQQSEKHVLPKWGAVDLGAVKPLAVDRWFLTLPLAQKTKAHIKSVMRQVFEYAMLCEMFEMQRNPMDLVRIEGGTLTEKEPLILTPEQFGCLIRQIITEPHRTMVLVAMCLGLRRSEMAGLKWSDFDWTNQQVLIQRSVIANRVDAVKTKRSKARLPSTPR